MYCTQCGAHAQQGARYCPQCGSRLIVVDEKARPARPDHADPAPGPQQGSGGGEATSTAEFLNAAAASGIEAPQPPEPVAVPAPASAGVPGDVSNPPAIGVVGPTIVDVDEEDDSTSASGVIGITLIVVGLVALLGFAVLVAFPKVTGINIIDVEAILGQLQPDAIEQGNAPVAGDADGGEDVAGPDDADQAEPVVQTPSVLDEPAAVTVSYESVVVDGDERFGYPVFSASLRGTAADAVNSALKKDVEAAAANAVPVEDANVRGTYNGAYTTRTFHVGRSRDGVVSVVGRGFQTNGSGKGWNVVDGINFDIVSGVQVSAASLLGVDEDELEKATLEAVTALVESDPETDWWDDGVQTWQENLAGDFETGFVHYFCIDEGVCAAVNELTLAPKSAGMQIVFVAELPGSTGGYEPGDRIEIDDVVSDSGSFTVSAAQVAESLGVEAPRVDSATGNPIVTEG